MILIGPWDTSLEYDLMITWGVRDKPILQFPIETRTG